MADINNQPILFTSSGLLSAQTGPGGISFAVTPTTGSGQGGQPKKLRISGIKVLKTGGAGSVEVFDSASASSNAEDSVYETDANEIATNLGIRIVSGDIFVKITGGFKVWLYLDFNK